MRKLGGVFATDVNGYMPSQTISTENVGGLIIDLGAHTDELKDSAFDNSAIVELNIRDDVEAAFKGANGALVELAKYHLEKFFKIAGEPNRLFVIFADCSKDFDAIENLQTAAHGIIDHVAIWTEQELFVKNNAELTLAPWVSEVEKVAERVGGSIRKKGGTYVNYDGNAPLVVVVNGNTASVGGDYNVDIKTLADATVSEYPLVSIILGQESSKEVHDIQAKLTHFCPVGNVGAALGVLGVAPVENSIGWVAGYNLGEAGIKTAELGFGMNASVKGETGGKDDFSKFVFTSLDSLPYYKRSAYFVEKGFNILTDYEGVEDAVFFSNDQTLSTGDYSTISLVRTIHKSRRLVRKALLPLVNQKFKVNTTDGKLPAATITSLQNTVINALDNGMVDPGVNAESQISGRVCTINTEQNLLKNHSLDIDYGIIPVGIAETIYVTEHFQSSTK